VTSDIRTSPDVELFLLEEEGVFFAENRQELYVFNTPATFVWCCLEEGNGPREIAAAYATAFAIDPGEAEHHVFGILREWEGLGHISGFAEAGEPDADLTMALGWLLTNARLREDFARSPTDVARRLRVRPADVEAFVSLNGSALEAQARAVAQASPRRQGERPEHTLASVCTSGRSVLEVAAGARLRAVAAALITRHYRLLGTQFCLRLQSIAQDARVHAALAHLETSVPAVVDVVLDLLEADGDHLLCEDVLPVGHCAALDQVVPMVKARVRQAAINRHRYFMAIHAGVVARGERCLLLPGAPGRGKTTLTAALSREGFRYFSDEFAILEEKTLRVCPVPLGLTVKPGAVGPLIPYYPEIERLPEHTREDGQLVRYLSPPRDPAGWRESASVGWIVFPMYAPDAVTALRPVSKPDTLRRLLQECLVLPERLDRAGVEGLVRWMREVSCHELPMSSLGDAVRLLKELAE